MKGFVLGTTAALALLAGASIASAQSTTVTTTTTTGAVGGTAVTISPAEETEIRTYVTKERWRSVDVPAAEVVVGRELPSTVELHTVPKVEKYRVAVVGGRTVLVDPGTRKIVKIIEK